jgi:hypothetical protein
MAAMLNLSRADVTAPGVEHKGVVIIVQGNVATLRDRRTGALVERLEEVTAVTRVAAGRWSVTFADGVQWVVVRGKGCGCGGGR